MRGIAAVLLGTFCIGLVSHEPWRWFIRDTTASWREAVFRKAFGHNPATAEPSTADFFRSAKNVTDRGTDGLRPTSGFQMAATQARASA